MSAFAARAAEDAAAAEPILDPYELMPLEIASGLVFGFTPHVSPPVPDGDDVPTAREALECAILPALDRAPCLMSFSGGTASSAVLAVAVQLARREGLELPVAATNRIEGLVGPQEAARQEQVIIRLGLTDWIRFDFDDELDLVGPVAMRVLRRHGFLWPSHAHVSVPLIEWAAGGSLITGLGRRLKEYRREIQVIAIEPEDALHGLEGLKHMASSIVPAIYHPEELDEVMPMETEPAWELCERLSAEAGLFVGHSAGGAAVGALRVAKRLAARGEKGCIVCIFPDRGDRYFEPGEWKDARGGFVY